MSTSAATLPLVLVSLISTSAAVQGPPQTGTQVPGKESAAAVNHFGGSLARKRLTKEEAERSRAREVMQQFAQCLVKSLKRRPEAAALVLDDIPNSEIIQKHSRLIDPDCLPYRENTASMELRLPGDYFRYALAEALILAEVRQPFTDFKAVPLLAHREHDPSAFAPEPGKKRTKRYLDSLEKGRVEDLAQVFASKFGECVVRMDPLNSHRLLTTKPSSGEEGAVFQALQPSLANCLPAGQTVKIARSMARGAIAVNYYRLAQAARGISLSQGVSK